MKHVRERREGGGDRTRAGEEERGGAGWCGAPRACAWLWLARMRGLWSRGCGRSTRRDGGSERIVSGLFPEEFEEVDRLTMGEDVQHRAALFCAPSRVIFLYFVPIWCFPMVLAFWFIFNL